MRPDGGAAFVICSGSVGTLQPQPWSLNLSIEVAKEQPHTRFLHGLTTYLGLRSADELTTVK